MKLFHEDLLSLSVQQSPEGRLPRGLLKEICKAGKTARKSLKSLTRTQLLELDKMDLEKNPGALESIARGFAEKGLYSRWLPGFAGGGGGHPLAFFGLNMEMGSRCLAVSNLLGSHYVALGLVSATQSFRVLRKITADITAAESRGEFCTAALAITEPSAGSDLEDVELIAKASVVTKAVKVSGGYRISGQKIFISNSSFSTWIVGSAFTDLKNPLQSLLIFAVRTKTEGLTIGRMEKKLGQNASPASVLFFDNVFIPDEDICFSPEQFKRNKEYLQNAEMLLNDLLSLSRAGVGCLATGAQKRILEIVIEKTREQQDKEWMQSRIALILQNFIVSKTVAWEGHVECYSRGPYKALQSPVVYSLLRFIPVSIQRIFPGKLLELNSVRDSLRKNRRTSIRLSDEKMIFGWGALVKGFCSDKAMESARQALELVGYDGSDDSKELEKILRDLKLLQIYEGTNELNLLMCFKNFVGSQNETMKIFRE